MCGNHFEYKDDCLDCIKETSYNSHINRYAINTFDKEDYIDKVVRAGAKEVALYSAPGEAVRNTVKPGAFIGRVEAFNTKGNWIKIAGGNTWIYFDPKNLVFKELDKTPVEKTTTQLVTEKLFGALGGTASAPAAGIAADKAANDIADAIDFDTIKWVLISILVLVVVFMLYKILK